LKYLIAGLGNIGEEYENTRHNAGFMILDALTGASNIVFTDKRYGSIAEMKYKGRTLILLKPSTFMNRSGNAVNYWLQKEKIPTKNLLVITDDIAIPTGSVRLRSKGSSGGHNGLANISEILGTEEYARIRIGIGGDFPKGGQINYVLGKMLPEEIKIIKTSIPVAIEMIKSFATIGCELTMTAFNKKGKEAAGNGNKD
jgi:peptidyl-tRNA hydrolase, PTH1 family